MIQKKVLLVLSWLVFGGVVQISTAGARENFSNRLLTGSSIDSDLSGDFRVLGTREVPVMLSPDKIQTDPAGPFQIQVLREKDGALEPISGLPTQIEGCSSASSQSTHIEVPLRNEYFEVTNGNEVYKISADASCQGTTRFIFNSDGNGGQALGIWQIAHLAQTKMEPEVGLRFWNSPVTFVWPDEADYYSMGQVHITRGDHWDVVGHELGHAIYDLGDLGTFGGGQHKIDECYGADLALSEGWASFFSGWLSVDLNDSDAKFEFMVPRRAPIRFETIPADVCRGSNNEWRVTGFFWDLLDLHDDSEKSELPFGRIWNAMKGSRISSVIAAKDRLKQAGIAPATLQLIWDLNF